MVFFAMISGLWSFLKSRSGEEEDASGWRGRVGSLVNHCMEQQYFQIPRYLEDQKGQGDEGGGVERLLTGQFMLYQYMMFHSEPDKELEDERMAERIRLQEGADEDFKDIDEDHLDYGKDALHIDSDLLEEMEKENHVHNTGEEQESEKDLSPGEFQEAEYPAYTYDWSENWDYEALLSNFYAVDNSTVLRQEYTDLEELLYTDLSVDEQAQGPQILIYHTHASESFLDSVPGDPSTTIVGAGERLAELLREKYGFQVMHHTECYDHVRDEAYNESLPAIEKILDENPTIEVVIDLHRDAVDGDRKLVMDLQGRPTARFMFFNGLSYGRRSGEITYLENPYIQDNLAFSFQVQVAANEYYPGLARKIYLKAYRYNMHLRPRSLLIELGAQNNTVEEIMNACDPLAHILSIVLK